MKSKLERIFEYDMPWWVYSVALKLGKILGKISEILISMKPKRIKCSYCKGPYEPYMPGDHYERKSICVGCYVSGVRKIYS